MTDRRKSLKSVRRHNRDANAIVLEEEEAQEQEEVVEEMPQFVEISLAKTPPHDAKAPVDWIDDGEARSGFVHYISFLYALLAFFFLVVEGTINDSVAEKFWVGIIFHYYMYSVAILFLLYVNIFIINTPWFNRILYFLADKGLWKNAENHVIMPASHNAESVSTLYLRMGTLFFGCAGVMLHGLELFCIFSGRAHVHSKPLAVGQHILGIVFTFTQMYFMNVNFKLLVLTSRNVCRFGFMHCFALNLWIWFNHAAAKAAKIMKTRKKNEEPDSSSSSSDSAEKDSVHQLIDGTADTTDELVRVTVDYVTTTLSPEKEASCIYLTNSTNCTVYHRNTIASLETFGHLGSFLNTGLIEYSLIGAAVMFVFWTHLDSSKPQRLHKEKRSVRIDFTSSGKGLYLGVIIFILGAVVCGIHAVFHNEKNPSAYRILGIYESICFSTCIISVMIATIFMRSLVLAGHRHGEDVDFLLLYVAFCGEVVWCAAEIAKFAGTGGVCVVQTNGEESQKATPDPHCSPFVFAVTLVRLSHVFSQTWFILMACKLELASTTRISALRGRQCVTFMLVTNVTLFFFHIYESMTDGFGYTSKSSDTHSYIKLLAMPIIAFYRFHCSVCLAEVWKKTFSRPKAHSQDDVQTTSSSKEQPMTTPNLDRLSNFYIKR